MRTLIRTAVAGLALLLGACTGGGQDPTPPPTTPTTSSASPTPSPTPSPSPSPTPTLDPDQAAARDVVLKYSQLMSEYGMDTSKTDLTPLANITTGVAQRIMIATLDSYRERGVVQTAPFMVTLVSVGQATVDASGVDTIVVTVCVDSSDVDLVTEETGESVLASDREAVHDFAYDVVREDQKWLISDVVVSPAGSCQ